jgi:putative ABC transport system substrate-binding protein
VIVTHQFSAPAAMAATQTIPIVFVSGADPVRAGLVQSLNRPGGNVTGISFFTSPLIAKRMELLSELVPKPAVIAVLLDPNWAESAFEVREVQEAARTLGREILMLRARSVLDLDSVLGTMAQARPGALLVGSGGFLNASQRRKLVAFTAREGIAAISSLRQFVEAGGLMSYGNSQTDAYRQAGLYVGRILKGEKPGELPVMRATKFELVINLRTAKALGMQIPPTLLARADEVIE